jgi:hypothetical protein
MVENHYKKNKLKDYKQAGLDMKYLLVKGQTKNEVEGAEERRNHSVDARKKVEVKFED